MEVKQLDKWEKTTADRISQVSQEAETDRREIRAFGLNLSAYYLNRKYYVQLANGDCYRTR